jgi:hypothetical protein
MKTMDAHGMVKWKGCLEAETLRRIEPIGV